MKIAVSPNVCQNRNRMSLFGTDGPWGMLREARCGVGEAAEREFFQTAAEAGCLWLWAVMRNFPDEASASSRDFCITCNFCTVPLTLISLAKFCAKVMCKKGRTK